MRIDSTLRLPLIAALGALAVRAAVDPASVGNARFGEGVCGRSAT